MTQTDFVTIKAFLRTLMDQLENNPGRTVFDEKTGRLVIGWAMSKLDTMYKSDDE